jgi:hypothetical protein
MSIDHNRIKVSDLEKNQPNKILTTNSTGELVFSDINNSLDCTVTGKVLDARQGKVLQESKVDKAIGKSLVSDTEVTRLATLSNYAHPANHPPSIITQDTNNRFVTDVEKATWNAKQSLLGFTAENTTNKNNAGGYAGLGADGKLISSQLPSITISDTFVMASQTTMLALTAETGDVAVRTDLNKSFILKGTNPTVLANWQELLTPTSAVSSVFGRNGVITASTGDYNADQISETLNRRFQTDSQKIFNDATSSIQTQLNGKTPLNGVGTSGIWPIDITGDAYLWGGYSNNFRIGNSVAYMDGIIGTSNARPDEISSYSPSSVGQFLGLGSNAYNSTSYLPLTGGEVKGLIHFPQKINGNSSFEDIITYGFPGQKSRIQGFNNYAASTGAGIRFITHNVSNQDINALLLDTNGTATFSGTVNANQLNSTLFTSSYLFSRYGNSQVINAGTDAVYFGNPQISSLVLESAGDFRFTSGVGLKMTLTSSGNLSVLGDVIAFSSSDKRLKKNIKLISKPLEKLSKIGGYTFDWNSKQDAYKGSDVGVIAQEIESVLPELVTTRDNGYKAVKYDKLIALLIEGTKEQQKLIERQNKQLKKQQAQISLILKKLK